MQQQTYDLEGPVRASVVCSAGEVRVTTTDAARAEVEVTPMRDDDVSRDAAENTTIELRGSDLVVDVPRHSGTFFGREPRVRVEVRVPHDSALAFTTASADVTATGRFGVVRGKTASGDVSVSDAAEVRIESASGDIRADEVRGEAVLRSASGDISVGDVGGPLDAHVVSGDLAVRSAANGATVQAVSGDIEVAAVARGGVEVRTVSGDVTLGVPPGTRVHVDVSTVTGDLKSDVDLGETPSAGDDGPLVEIRGRTVSGDLRVRRAVAAS